MFQNPFSFEGRIRRTEYGVSFIIYLMTYLFATLLTEQSGIFGLLFIPVLWFKMAQSAKRCHDRGNTGWFQIIPFYGLWMTFAESDYGDNEYGPNPKGIGNNEVEIDDIGKHLVEF